MVFVKSKNIGKQVLSQSEGFLFFLNQIHKNRSKGVSFYLILTLSLVCKVGLKKNLKV